MEAAMNTSTNHTSSMNQMRNGFLTNDIGSIDITQETPVNQNLNQQNANQNYLMNQTIQQRPQYQFGVQNQHFQQNVPQQFSGQMAAQQQGYNGMSPGQRYQQNHASQARQPKTEPKKSHSLTQKSFSNFFKSKNHFGKFKRGNNMDSVGTIAAEESERQVNNNAADDVILNNTNDTFYTFNDIQKAGYKQGDKFNHNSSTTPIIPTIITTNHNDMSSTEYRKYMTNQRKMAMSAVARQQQQGPQNTNNPRTLSLQQGNPNINNPRTLSLQQGNPNMNNPRAMSLQQGAPRMFPPTAPNNISNNNNDVRTMSLQQGPPRQFNQTYMNNSRSNTFMNSSMPRPPIPQQQGAPRTMSLTNNQQRPFTTQNHMNMMHPQLPGFNNAPMPLQQNNIQPQNRNMVQNRGQIMPNMNQNLNSMNNLRQLQNPPPSQDPLYTSNNRGDSLYPNNNSFPSEASNNSPVPGYVSNSSVSTSMYAQEPLGKESSNISQPKLNVIKLSEPQQIEIKQREQQLAKRASQLQQREDKINEKEREVDIELEQNLNLRPNSALENGLQNLNISDDHMRYDQTAPTVLTEKVLTFNSLEKDKPVSHQSKNTVGTEPFSTTDDFQKEMTMVLDAFLLLSYNSKRISIADNRRGSSTIEKHSSESNINVDITDASIQDDTFQYKKDNYKKYDTLEESDKDNENDEFNFDNTVTEKYKYTDVTGKKSNELFITGDNLTLLNENKALVSELTLLSTELAESIKRETILSKQLNLKLERGNQSLKPASLSDFESELEKNTSKVVELIKQVNEERLKRFIAEERALLLEKGENTDSLELLHLINELKFKLKMKDDEVADLKLRLNTFEKQF
ncbi:hypothetical protein KAFR_0A00440 [Kazachstania africana CBS 2517]|uniref:Uncharacterized protein n=1 Tax=Kazachstania africana (strain ATCC 22294 / BCRC 22015 / CBS 2517 / CECT 1963 / NBRC 1671 / NRRL Y-8276) TaxID=1071382 RepID=H2AM82_KAZAF|nr:hypothetical protein KAFR_0A00440 [Kazachstania africana CBS 2517]CCF55482.1 hypothetical protein KAFR_0A00440 [Kazachstania africana CBS 2517]